ncbi:MAG: hypothetical protein CMO81_09365 [Waddliaceae bacterium]|nr:hypothetical protein [Waddliaceae bacterium]
MSWKIRPIAKRRQAISHRAGTLCALPGARFALELFPTKWRVLKLSGDEDLCVAEVDVNLSGPLKDFTILQDLDRAQVVLSAHAKEGFFRIVLQAMKEEQGISLYCDRSPESGFPIQGKGSFLSDDIDTVLLKGQKVCLGKESLVPSLPLTSLCCGVHKKADWALVERRKDLREILPYWFHVASLLPLNEKQVVPLRWKESIEAVEAKAHDQIGVALIDLWDSAFEGMWVPRLSDFRHLGIEVAKEECAPFDLLAYGARYISQLFLREEELGFSVLPSLPKELFCGRFMNVSMGEWGTVDIEWSKKQIRRMVFRASKNGELLFTFQNFIRSFRLRQDGPSFQDRRGKTCESGKTISVESGKVYYLDHFQR